MSTSIAEFWLPGIK